MVASTGATKVAETIDAVCRFTEKAPVVAVTPDRKGLAAALWRHSAMTRRFEGHKCDILGISLRGEANLEQMDCGRSVWRGPAAGSVVLLRADEATDWNLDGSFEMLHIYLPNQVCNESFSPALNRPFRDPILMSLAKSTALALQESEGLGGYVAPLLESITRLFDERYVQLGRNRENNKLDGLGGYAQNLVLKFISENLQKEITVETLANIASVSPSHFHRVFSATFGTSPRQFLIDRRVDRAAMQIRNSHKNLATIASECGFSSASHFGLEFRKRLGVTPGLYRKTN